MKSIGESNGNTGNSSTNWTTRDKLYLVSSVLINGDQNWSLISEQLNKIRDYEHEQSQGGDPPSIFSLSDCSKQYKSLVSSHGDAKKIYSALSKERLRELDDNLKKSSQEYDDLYKEIELILSGAMDSQLIETNKRPSEINDNLEGNASIPAAGQQKSDIENLENTQPLTQLKPPATRKGSNASTTKPAKIIDREFTIVREKRHSSSVEMTASSAAAAVRKLSLSIGNKSETEAQKTLDVGCNKESMSDDDELSDGIDDDEGVQSHKSSSSSENIEYLRWKPITSQGDVAMNVEEDLNKSSSRRSTDSTRLKSTDQQSTSFEKRSSIEWKPVVIIDGNDKPSVKPLDKPAASRVVARLDSSSSRSLRGNSSSNGLKNSASSSSLIEQAAAVVVVVDDSSNLTESRVDEEVKVKLECTEEDMQKRQSSERMDVSFPPEADTSGEASKKSTVEAKQDADSNKTELIFTPKINITDKDGTANTEGKTVEQLSTASTERVARVGRKPSQNRPKKPDVENPPSLRGRSLRNAERNKTQTITSVTEDPAISDDGKVSSENNNTNNNQEAVSSSESVLTTEDVATKNANEVGAASTIRSIKNEPIVNDYASETGDNEKSKDLNKTSESQEAAASRFEDEKAYKAWKKSITMVLSNITSHKHATVFMQPVRDEIAPGYRNVVYRPMDLSTIKKNIENGSIKTTKEFQRDIMLMFTNAIMYNSSNHDVYKIGLEMYKEVMHTVEQLLDAQENVNENKPLRFKEARNSTTSDKDNIESESDVANLLSNKSINAQISASSDSGVQKADDMETASNSNSSISTAAVNSSNKKRRVSTEQAKTAATATTTKRRKR